MTLSWPKVFLFLSFILTTKVSAVIGQTEFAVTYQFSLDTVEINGVQTFSNKFIVINHTDQPISLIRDTNLTVATKALIKLPESIHLNAQERKSYPLKFLADRSSIREKVQAFTFGYVSDNEKQQVQPEATFFTHVEDQGSLILTSNQAEYYIDPTTQQVQFMLRVVNRGLLTLNFQVEVASTLNDIELIGENLPLQLAPGSQDIITYTAVLRSQSRSANATILFRAKDGDGKVLASNRIQVASIGSVQQFGSGSYSSSAPLNNQVSLRFLSMNQHQSILQLQGNGGLDLKKGRTLDYRLNLDYFREVQALNLYNTHLDYQQESWGVKLGNIYENLDYSISGRGIKVSFKPGSHKAIQLYLVDNDYMLINQYSNPIPRAKIIAAAYEFSKKSNQHGRVSYLHSNDHHRDIRSHQVNLKMPLRTGNNQSLSVEGGYSLEQTDAGPTKHAVAAGLQYDVRFGDYQIGANGYFSSPYYTGLRRGIFQANARIVKSLSANRSVYLRMNVMNNNPKHQGTERLNYFDNRRGVQLYELGLREKVGVFQVDIKPYLMLQQMTVSTGFPTSAQESWYANSIRTALDVNYAHQDHRFSLRTDYGWAYRSKTESSQTQYHSLRLNGQYRNQWFGVHGHLQMNPYYLSDLLSVAENRNHTSFSVGPNVNFQTFNGKMDVQMSGMYSYYGASETKNVSLNGDVSWKLARDWKLTANIYYSVMQNRMQYLFENNTNDPTHTFDNRQIRLGIEKQFSGLSKHEGHRLDLLFFKDLNGNGVQDQGEQVLAGVVAKIGKNVARSDVKGRMRFTNMSAGSHDVITQTEQGLSSLGSIRIVLTKNRKVEVPLIETNALRGRIKPMESKYVSSQVTLLGIPVVAVDKLGQEYKTLSDGQGNFVFFLSPGPYTVLVKNEGLPFKIMNDAQQIEIISGQSEVLEDFNYLDQRRNVDVKRF